MHQCCTSEDYRRGQLVNATLKLLLTLILQRLSMLGRRTYGQLGWRCRQMRVTATTSYIRNCEV